MCPVTTHSISTQKLPLCLVLEMIMKYSFKFTYFILQMKKLKTGKWSSQSHTFFFFLNQAIVPFTVSLRWKDCKGLLPRHPVPVRVWMGGQHKQEGCRGDASFHLLQFKGTGCSVLPQPKTQEAKWTVTQAGSRYTQITVATLGLTVHTAHTRLKRGWSKGEICVWAVAMNTSGRAWWL